MLIGNDSLRSRIADCCAGGGHDNAEPRLGVIMTTKSLIRRFLVGVERSDAAFRSRCAHGKAYTTAICSRMAVVGATWMNSLLEEAAAAAAAAFFSCCSILARDGGRRRRVFNALMS